jgi:hypothetical protein
MQSFKYCTENEADNLGELINPHILKEIALVHSNYSGITLCQASANAACAQSTTSSL